MCICTGGARGLEEEERRITLWKTRFEMDDSKVEAMRRTFETMVISLPGAQRSIPLGMVKKAIELASAETDTADLHQNDKPEQGRPTVGEDELKAYIQRLNELWQEVCDTDASEVCNRPGDNQAKFQFQIVVAAAFPLSKFVRSHLRSPCPSSRCRPCALPLS
jgi:hypothetical protein